MSNTRKYIKLEELQQWLKDHPLSDKPFVPHAVYCGFTDSLVVYLSKETGYHDNRKGDIEEIIAFGTNTLVGVAIYNIKQLIKDFEKWEDDQCQFCNGIFEVDSSSNEKVICPYCEKEL